MKRQIIAIGGGGFSAPPDQPELETYLLRSARRCAKSHSYHPGSA